MELSQNDELEYNNYVKTHNVYNEIRKIKEEKKVDTYLNEKSLDHDAFLFSVVVKNCNKHAKKLEDNRYIILTSDILLAKNNTEFSESLKCPNIIISDMQFAVKLFIHNSCKSSSLTIKQILKYHANSLIIDNNIWDKLINIIEHMLNNEMFSESDNKEYVYSKIKEALCFNSTLQATLHEKNISDNTLKVLIHNILSDDSHSEYMKNKELKRLNNEQKELSKQIINEKELEIQNINNEKDVLEISSRKEQEKLINENKKLKKNHTLFIVWKYFYCLYHHTYIYSLDEIRRIYSNLICLYHTTT